MIHFPGGLCEASLMTCQLQWCVLRIHCLQRTFKHVLRLEEAIKSQKSQAVHLQTNQHFRRESVCLRVEYYWMLKSGSEASSWCRELTDSCWLLCRRWPCVGFTYRFRAFTFNMSNFHSELTPKQRELLKIRRDSDTKAAELVKMEKMLQQTKDLLDRKTESCSDSMDLQENMGLYHILLSAHVC